MTTTAEAGTAAAARAGAVVEDVSVRDLHLRPVCESCMRTPSTVTVRWPDAEFATCAECAAIVQAATMGGSR